MPAGTELRRIQKNLNYLEWFLFSDASLKTVMNTRLVTLVEAPGDWRTVNLIVRHQLVRNTHQGSHRAL